MPFPIAGNGVDKYLSQNPVVKRLMARFVADFDSLCESVGPASALDVGCGEGRLTQRLAVRQPGTRVIGADLHEPSVEEARKLGGEHGPAYVIADIARLPYSDGEFDLVCAIEVLEHVDEPHRALREMARVARSHLLVSVPREPAWRVLNVARGAYLRSLGNTPGHVQHWSVGSFTALLSGVGELEQLRLPPPWIMALVRLR